MKMWSMKVIILLLFCYASLSTGNQTAYFVSRNFYNVLHWDLMKPAFPGEKVLYSVQYWSDATEQFRIKEECQNITALSCDLTAETPSVHDVQYWAKVYCNGRSCGSTLRLKPIAQTVFGPPTLSTYPRVSSLYVNVTLPLGPNGVSIADIITSSKKGPSKTVINYILKITHPTWAAQVHESTTGQFVISLKNNQTEYCGHVAYSPSTEWGRPKGEQASFCVTLPGDPLTLLPWLLVSAALLTAVITTSVVCMCKYTRGGKEKSIPQLLVTPFSTPTRVLQSPDRNVIISKAEVCIKSDQTVYATIRMKPNLPSVVSGGYSPQDILCQAWQDGTGSSFGTGEHSLTPNPEDTSAQSSEIYSVVAVHEPNEDIQQATNDNRGTSNLPMSSSRESLDKAGARPKLSSHGVQPLPHPDPCESNPAKPLLLQTVRDTNGQLVLPSLIFQLQSSTDDTVPPLNPERKPLLSDLMDSKTERPSLASLKSHDGSELSDSGCDDSTVTTPTQTYCNTHYSPSQPVAPYFHQGWKNPPSSDALLESGYKQNGLPEILFETASEDSCEYRKTDYPRTWTGHKKEEQGEEDEDRGEEETRQILLGGWVVQIQE
ncbi:interferon lambda receptor 1 [Cyclopterus lumpus]|uniref:Fibronectin type-III domain-containing protein n=1 Tax=Cyclopterus lumpus TaxID=8103 RepID=A0A8C2XH62_CYCLU|nr:interferon lambda receptor 1 [Cyclopterus lumpus]XP_034410348.1 interferon lambda receptor 1 [Cyclopterus lumpus]